jgi:hypothetical protein
LSESDIPIDGELDITCLDDDSLAAITNLDLKEFYYNEVLEELEGRAELIDEDDANALYGVSTVNQPFRCTLMGHWPKGGC